MEWIDLAQKFQIAIAAIFGFTGVCLTLWQNSRLSRSQISRIRSETRKAVANAYHVELSNTVEVAKKNMEMLKSFKKSADISRSLDLNIGSRVECYDRIKFEDTILLSKESLGKVIS